MPFAAIYVRCKACFPSRRIEISGPPLAWQTPRVQFLPALHLRRGPASSFPIAGICGRWMTEVYLRGEENESGDQADEQHSPCNFRCLANLRRFLRSQQPA